MTFNTMPLSGGTKDAIAAMGYEEPTPIQTDAIPHLLAGRDVIGRAQTGTGKTAAFGIPMVEALRDGHADGVLGLILVPTRELALQVTEVLQDLAKGSRIKVVPVYGGTGFGKQTHGLKLRAPLIVVACPGRLLDLMQQGIARLDRVEQLVLDEADRMLDMGFIHDIRRILAAVPRDRQTSLFSATISRDIQKLSRDFLQDPVTIEVDAGPTATELTEQFHMRVEKSDKSDTLLALLHTERPDKAVVFTRTKHLAKRMAQKLQKQGWNSVALQGNMTQGQRERAMDAFRKGQARILVATDVAARGLDVPDITHVINFDVPMETEAYVHRVGRTGRNGRTGRAFTFVQSDQHRDLRDMERVAGNAIPSHSLASLVYERGPDTGAIAQAHGDGHRRYRPKGEHHGGPGGQGANGRHGGQGPRRHGQSGGRSSHGGARRPGGSGGGGQGGPRRNGPGGGRYGGQKRSSNRTGGPRRSGGGRGAPRGGSGGRRY